MGSIRRKTGEPAHRLEAEHLIGRAPACPLRLSPRYVSAHHAVLRWADGRWELRDLGSRNGTFLDGERLRAGEGHTVVRGSRIAFGNLLEEEWELADADAPLPMAVPLDGGDPIPLEGPLIALPSPEDPHVTLFRRADRTFGIEFLDAETTSLENLQTFEVGGRLWRFSCPEDFQTVSLWASPDSLQIRNIELSFVVSMDEEHVRVHLHGAGRSIDLGSRNHNYLLLTLARSRLKDAEHGVAEGICGWVSQEDLARDPTMTPPQLNLDIFRIRKHFGRAGVVDSASIIERRPRARQLRIGTGRLIVRRG